MCSSDLRIAPYLQPTPLYHYPALDALTGARVRVKHENHQPVGAFKVRGGVNLVSQVRRRGDGHALCLPRRLPRRACTGAAAGAGARSPGIR